MKFFATVVAAALLFQKVLSAPVHADLQARTADVCGYPVVPLYEVVSPSLSDHLWTTDATEAENAIATGEYDIDHVIAYVYDTTTGPNVPNATPLYRIYNAAGTDHYITTSWTEVEDAVDNKGFEYQGITGYVYGDLQEDCADAVPFYRTYLPTTPNHYYTTVLAHEETVVADDGYIYEGIAAYVFSP